MSAALAAPPLPGLPAPRVPDPTYDDEAIVLASTHPDRADISDAIEALRAARRALLRLADTAADGAVRATAAGYAAGMTDATGDLRYDVECWADDGWRQYCDAAQRLYEQRLARAENV